MVRHRMIPLAKLLLMMGSFRYWSLDLIHLLCLINQPRSESSSSHPQTLRFILHLHPHPSSTDTTKPKQSNSLEACRIRYTSLIKEADYARWGNTRRVTSLRRLDLESGWNSIVEGEFSAFSSYPALSLILVNQVTMTPKRSLPTRHCPCLSARTTIRTQVAYRAIRSPNPEAVREVLRSPPLPTRPIRLMPLELFHSSCTCRAMVL